MGAGRTSAVKAGCLFVLVGSTLTGCAPAPTPARAPAPSTEAPAPIDLPAYAGDPLATAVAIAAAPARPVSDPIGRASSPVTPRRSEPVVHPMEFTHHPPPRFAKVFEARRELHFLVIDDVDPHGEEGRRSRSRLNVTCTVVENRNLDGLVGAQLDCLKAGDVSDDEDVPVFPVAFVAAPGGIWMPSSLPASQAAAGDLIHAPPHLAEFPTPRRRTFDRPGMLEEESDRCVERVEVSGASTCYEELCDVAQGYGDTKLRVCLSSRGIELVQTENLDGPRTTRWQLQKSELPPEPESSCH